VAIREPASYTAFGMKAEAEPLTPGLHIVATPIGNLKDVSFRALGTLAAADVVFAEDTRVSRKLLAHYGITTPLIAYHEHNAAEMRPKIIARLKEGQALALISDAGTPLVSDPGYRLIEAVLAEGFNVVPVPGPSAVLAALVAAGLPTDRFFFEGFLPPKSAARRERLAALATISATLVFFESPHRLVDMLRDALETLGDRTAVVARELTKLYETVRRGTLQNLTSEFEAASRPKGEIVVLIGATVTSDKLNEATEGLDGRLRQHLTHLSVKDAVAVAVEETGLPRRQVYARAVALAKGDVD